MIGDLKLMVRAVHVGFKGWDVVHGAHPLSIAVAVSEKGIEVRAIRFGYSVKLLPRVVRARKIGVPCGFSCAYSQSLKHVDCRNAHKLRSGAKVGLKTRFRDSRPRPL